MREVTFTMDVEDPRPISSLQKRYDRITLEVLELLERVQIRGTFFFVGNLAQQDPELIKKVSDSGHEIGLHSLDHIPLTELNPEKFRRQTIEGKSLLEEVTGQAVTGYRAPIFSLTPKSYWATEILADLGFQYSSSVLPVKNHFYCFPGVPTEPFLWPSGLLELPAPVSRMGPLTMPYLGGFYFRYLPGFLVKKRVQSAAPNESLWFYCHPHDFDAGEPFYRIKNTSLIISLLLWFNRQKTAIKLERFFSGDSQVTAAQPFCEQIAAGKFDHIGPFTPAFTDH